MNFLMFVYLIAPTHTACTGECIGSAMANKIASAIDL